MFILANSEHGEINYIINNYGKRIEYYNIYIDHDPSYAISVFANDTSVMDHNELFDIYREEYINYEKPFVVDIPHGVKIKSISFKTVQDSPYLWKFEKAEFFGDFERIVFESDMQASRISDARLSDGEKSSIIISFVNGSRYVIEAFHISQKSTFRHLVIDDVPYFKSRKREINMFYIDKKNIPYPMYSEIPDYIGIENRKIFLLFSSDIAFFPRIYDYNFTQLSLKYVEPLHLISGFYTELWFFLRGGFVFKLNLLHNGN